ncbi:LysR family transcriptional regulator [Paracoccus yeei]|uniref:LysR family transcriptional regulator n=1 Tax=Paracoccus yeei TaxID=147645 RepID=A0A386UHT6_9RHOB|nr:LysR family transcriptional regulator [Paracoccus yeei]AYF00207.1 LysR family transcriptional regulator [Paracoccus yeei]
MRFKNLDLNLLAALDLLLTERNVSRAAERMQITQSAMSNALARLRDYFGDPLMVQVGRKFELTPRAESLILPVRDILVRIEASVVIAPQFDPSSSDRVFYLLASDSSLMTLIPSLLRGFERDRVSVGLEFHQQVDQPARVLERGEADVLIIPEDYASDEHPMEILYAESFVALVDADHPRIGDSLSMAAYEAEGHVVMKPRRDTPTYDTREIDRIGVRRRIDVATYSFAALPGLVAGTERIATVHRRLAERLAGSLSLKMMELPFEIRPMRQCAQWHSYRSGDRALEWLLGRLVDAVGPDYGFRP